MSSSSNAPLVATRWVEIGLALFTAALGAIVMYGSQDIGVGWCDSVPEAGYFPFYIGLLLSAASLGNLLMALPLPGAGYLVRRPRGLSPGACGVPADRRLRGGHAVRRDLPRFRVVHRLVHVARPQS